MLAAFHLLALGIGLAGVWIRGRSLLSVLDPAGLQRVFRADAVWGGAALLWIATGLWRLLGGVEKPTEYYLHNVAFATKMVLLLVILLLEIQPMVTLIRWRRRMAAAAAPDTRSAPWLAKISFVQAGLVVLMVFAATAMARGIGER